MVELLTHGLALKTNLNFVRPANVTKNFAPDILATLRFVCL